MAELPEVDPLTADVLGVLDRSVQAACAEIDRLRALNAELLATLERGRAAIAKAKGEA